MAKSIKYKDPDTYHDAGNVYDNTQGKTQEAINASLSSLVIVREVTVAASGETSTPLTIPMIDGYELLGCMGVRSNGWIGTPYIDYISNYKTKIWDINDVSNPTVDNKYTATFLYHRI